MASKTPVDTAITSAGAPVATPAPVKADAAPAPKADPVPVKASAPVPAAIKADVAPVAAMKAVAASVEKAVAKVAAPLTKAVAPKEPASVKPPVAKKKAVVKVAPKIALKSVKKVVVAAVAPVIAKTKTVTAPITTAPIPTNKEVNIMEATINNAAEKAKTLFADANAKSTAAFGDINDFAKGNIEAIVESGKIAAKGVEAMGQDAAEYTRKQFESATAALKSLSAVKSPTDFFKLQGDYMRASFDSMVAQTSKNTETLLKLAGEVAQPIQNRVSIAVEKVKIAA